MKPTKNQFLIALLTISLPLALVGCNRASSDADAKPTPPVVAPDSTPAPDTTTNTAGTTPATMPETTPGTSTTPNVAPVPADSSRANGNAPVDNTQRTAAPDESARTNVTTPDASQTPAAPNQDSK